jgi:hypothetical protein
VGPNEIKKISANHDQEVNSGKVLDSKASWCDCFAISLIASAEKNSASTSAPFWALD